METRELTTEEKARRRKRNIAIALTLGVLVILFYVTTMVRMSTNITAG